MSPVRLVVLLLILAGSAVRAHAADYSPPPDTSRDAWKPIPRTPFNEGSLGGDDGLRRVLEMVCAAVRE